VDRGDQADVERSGLAELSDSFSDTVRTLFSAGSVTETLTLVLQLAVATINGCDFAGLFLLENDVVTTPIHTDPFVDRVDGLQHLSGEGPCLDAIAQRSMFYAEDLAGDARWPIFGPQAAEAGMGSLLALPLATNGTLGALNLYARAPSAFDVVDRAKAAILASLASIALVAAHTQEDRNRRDDNVQAALDSREVIGQAQGILMERERITADEAFDILRRASQHLNLKLREVAKNLVETGERPDTGRTGAPPDPSAQS
jgi:hypothetical protein